jgi:hypothetical protein
MVKVLENSIIDLDILPGQQHVEIQRQLREQLNNANGQLQNVGQQAQGAVQGAAGQAQEAAGKGAVQLPKEMLPDSMSDEQKSQARSVAGTILDGGGNVIGGLAGTVGGVLKGVGDTTGNTVGHRSLQILEFITHIDTLFQPGLRSRVRPCANGHWRCHWSC